ncbi:MAG: TonB-dependent receptor [Bacteroidales bacterium]
MEKNISITKRLLLVAVSLLLCISAFAQQEITVKGVVTDENNEPLIGVGVLQESAASNGVITDANGKYSIKVPSNAVLVFSYISYQNQKVAVRGSSSLNVKLLPDNNFLDEVVVVGYGTMKRSDLTGSVASVSSKAIEDFKTSSVVEALGGQIAGVNITATDGTPGAGYDIKIRGVGSVNGSSDPLFIVDGFEVGNIDYLANQDIKSIEVLKDASASAIYGARAANGVVLVTTKSGIDGKPQIMYNGSASYRKISKTLDVMSPYDFVKLQVEVDPAKYGSTYYKAGNDEDGNPYAYQSAEDYISETGIDWQDEAFRETWSQNHDISIIGGNKNSKYTLSYSHFGEDGIFKNSGYAKNTARGRITQKVTKWLTVDATVNYTRTDKTGIGTSGGTLASVLNYRPVGGLSVTNDELLNSTYDPLAMSESNFNSNNSNPVKQTETVDINNRVEQWIANGSATLQLTKHLSFKTSGTYNTKYQRYDTFYGTESSQAFRAGGAYGSTQMTRGFNWSNNNVLTYQNRFKLKHNLNVMLGHETSFSSTEYLLGQAKDFPFDNLGNDNLALGATPSQVETSLSKSRRLSFFARAFYNFDDKYLLTATVRADGSTVFSSKNKCGYFPSFAAAWNVSKEAFMNNVDWVSNLKLRLGWGTVGNDRIANYLSMDLYTPIKYGVGSTQTTVMVPKQLANENLKWEGSTTTNVGLDLGLFKGRVNLVADAFIKDTKDLLLAQNLAYVTGFGSQWQNIGKIRNKGLELTLNTVNFSNGNFFWSTDLNLSFIKNTLESLQDGTDYMLSRSGFNSNFSNYDYIAYVGQSLGNMYGYVFDGIYQYSDFNMTPDDGMKLKEGVADISEHAGVAAQPGMTKYKDLDGNGIINTEDRDVIGNGLPDWYGGITNTFNIFRFDLSFLFQFSYGNDVYNATRMFTTQSKADRQNQLAEVADRWTTTNASNKVPSAEGYVSSELYSRFIEDGSYLRLKNITLGYTLPEKLLKKIYVSKLRVYVTAQNLFCLTNYSGYDPEVNTLSSNLMPGFDWGAYPKSRAFTFGIELQF